MVAFDSTTLLLFLSSNVQVPIDPVTNRPVDYPQERVHYLATVLAKRNVKILIPTPALSEVLVRAGAALPDYLSKLSNSAAFRIASFDERAAVEAAMMLRNALDAGDKRGGVPASTAWAKVKYDRQILAIAKVEGAAELYTDDIDLRTLAAQVGLKTVRLADVALPPALAQQKLALSPPVAPPPPAPPLAENDESAPETV